MIKIRHNFRILADGKTIRGQVLDCIFPTGHKRGDCHKYYSKVVNEFYIMSSNSPELDVKCHYILYIWGSDKEKDYDVIEYKYSTEWQAQKVMKHIEEFTIKKESKMIRTKEDFKGKYIKLPKNLSKKKFNKIKTKLERLGFENFNYFQYSFINSNSCRNPCMFIWHDGDIGIWVEGLVIEEIENPQEISIKDFLKEEEEVFTTTLNISCVSLKDSSYLNYVSYSNCASPLEGNLLIDAKQWELDKLNEDSYVFRKRPYKEYINNISIDTANGNIIVHNKKPIDVLIHYRIIESLDEEGYTLKKPFEVIIKKDPNDGDYIGTINELGIYCYDKDINEVIKEIKCEILDLYDSLVLDLKWELGKDLKRWRKILKKHIKYKKVKYET